MTQIAKEECSKIIYERNESESKNINNMNKKCQEIKEEIENSLEDEGIKSFKY
jgi:hypothetical protein